MMARARRGVLGRIGLSLRLRIGASFAVLAAIIVALGIFAADRVSRSGVAAADIFDRALIATSYARSAAGGFASLEVQFHRSQADADAAAQAERMAQIDEQAELVFGDIDIAVQRGATAAIARAGSAARAAAEAWIAMAHDATPGVVAARATLAAEAHEQFDQLVNHVAGEAFRQRQAARGAVQSAWVATASATAAATSLAIGLALLLVRRIIQPVAAASDAARRIAAGDLDAPMPRAGRDELGALLVAMARMRDAIRATIEDERAGRRSAQSRLSDALQGSSEGIVLTNAQGQIAIANARTLALLPEAGEALQPGSSWAAALERAATGFVGGTADVAQALGGPPPGVAEIARHDGGWLRVSRSPAQEGGAVAILSDVTLLKRREVDLAEANRRFGVALASMTQGLALFDSAQRLLVMNARANAMLNLSPTLAAPGTSWEALIDEIIRSEGFRVEEAGALRRDALRFAERRSAGRRIWHMPDGRHLAVLIAATPDGGFVATFQDVTEAENAQAQITHLARHDQLTGLPNRTLARERIASLFAEGAFFAVHAIDLLRFREVNECHGVLAADRILAEVAHRLRDALGPEELAARLSGDDFVIVQPCPDETAAEALALRVMAALALPYDVDGEAQLVVARLGYALAPADAGAVDMLLRYADIACVRAAGEGADAPRRFHPDMDQALRARRTLEADLRRALAEDALELHYQPLVDTRSGTVSGFEALLRWTHPTRGRVSPAEFIPVAEQSGLIVPIGEWVIRRATRDAAAWPAAVKIAVNVSPLQFRSARLADVVFAALQESGLARGRLEIEITESTLIDDADLVLAMLHRLRAAGVRAAIDDFGTGYSSLATLRAFPFDKIKIDQSFVRVPEADIPQAQAIVQAVAGLAAALGMRCTAEGVETQEQFLRLRAAGCTEVQGYLFGKPAHAAEAALMIERINGMAMAPAE